MCVVENQQQKKLEKEFKSLWYSKNQLTHDVVDLLSSTAQLWITETIQQSKNVLFKNNQLYWIDLLKSGRKTVPMSVTIS